ncbi:unnamed protein product [Cladocopium goreaui]|uniref:Uncharacterized protein n=1 Tax=Cladocopium goreaui TaxID=2562237 RepID=A0A9P1DNF9_9DINO|nr:unnamed protein product [Cladocopium goreaui]
MFAHAASKQSRLRAQYFAWHRQRSQRNWANKTCGGWHVFCNRWNEAIGRRPLAMVVFFNATNTLTWVTTLAALSRCIAQSHLQIAPDFAVGWLVMRSTVKLRQPLNLALAAGLSKLAPSLSMLKVSPLLTAFATDTDTRNMATSAWAKIFRCRLLGVRGRSILRRSLQDGARLFRWAEGPIDRCGLAFFLSCKFTNICILCATTAASMRGLDLSSFCDFGHFQKVPMHFYGAVGSLRVIESLAARAWQELAEDDLGKTTETTETEMTEEVFTKNLISLATALAAAFDLAVTFYLIWHLTGPGLAHPWMSGQPAAPLEPGEQKRSRSNCFLTRFLCVKR